MSITSLIRPATKADGPAVEALLDAAGLPLEGVADALEDFLVAREGDRVVGAIGLEIYDGIGLLRSAVVDPAARSTGLGSKLTEALIARARERGMERLYLLTTTAEGFFARFGFQRIERTEVPAAIRTSAEFTSVCPADATVMVLELERSSR